MIYNVWFHPLSRVPGPRLWACSRIRFIRSLLTGNLVIDVRKLHERYGDVVRTAPDEVSFAREGVWADVFSSTGGRKPFPRDQTFFKSPPGQAENLVTTVNFETSVRMRQVIGPAFTDRAVAKAESILVSYVMLMMNKMREQVVKPENAKIGAMINVVDWMNWYTFDVVGMLALGESFDCLKDTANHPWANLIYHSIKSKLF